MDVVKKRYFCVCCFFLYLCERVCVLLFVSSVSIYVSPLVLLFLFLFGASGLFLGFWDFFWDFGIFFGTLGLFLGLFENFVKDFFELFTPRL